MYHTLFTDKRLSVHKEWLSAQIINSNETATRQIQNAVVGFTTPFELNNKKKTIIFIIRLTSNSEC